MTIRERLTSFFRRNAASPIPTMAQRRKDRLTKKTNLRAIAPNYSTSVLGLNASAARGLAGGRISQDNQFGFVAQTAMVVLPPLDADQDWRLGNLDSDTLSRISPQKLLELLADLSPDVSRALFDFIRLCNPGWECKVYNVGSEEVENAQGQAVIDDFFAKLKDIYGTIDVIIGRLFMGAFIRGAFLSELVLDLNKRDGVDLVTPDPYSIRFQLFNDPVRGMIPRLVQWQFGDLVSLDTPTIKYIPIDPFPGNPYGRSLASPAVFTALFMLGLLHDLRRVVAQQGYPRLDIAINLESLRENMPSALEGDPTAWKEWVAALTDEVANAYSQLEPDDAYVHTDTVSVNKPVGTVGSDSLGAVDGLIRGLERMSVRALKTTPFMMGTQDSQTETQANRVWEAHLQNIKSIQHYCETLLERLLNILLQVNGVLGTVEFRFAENRASEMMRDEQTRALVIANTMAEYQAGWISQDEAAEKAVGHKPDATEPRAPVGIAPAPDTTTQPEPGVNRTVNVDNPAEWFTIFANRLVEESKKQSNGNGHGKELIAHV